MLSILHPQIVPVVQDFPGGLLPVSVGNESRPKLIVKTTKEMLLAAKVNRGFKIYVIPMTLAGNETIGLISAFFDDEDEPLVIFTPLFGDDGPMRDLLEALKCDTLDIHFFDEHTRELLGYVATLNCPPTTKDRLTSSSLCTFDRALAISALNQMPVWFGQRSHDDDLSAIEIVFGESLIPDDIFYLDARPNNHDYHGSSDFSFSQLEREEPGGFQEQDIAHLLKKLFSPKQIYMNPLRITDRKEIADLLVLTESEVIVVQAKDSPNIERVLRNDIERKRSTTRKALDKAISQEQGAIRYMRSISPLKILVGGETLEIDISRQTFRALIVVKELFDDEYSVYSPPILKLSEETQVPCIALDYGELHMYMAKLSSEEAFFQAFDRVFSHGVKTGKFPRLRIW